MGNLASSLCIGGIAELFKQSTARIGTVMLSGTAQRSAAAADLEEARHAEVERKHKRTFIGQGGGETGEWRMDSDDTTRACCYIPNCDDDSKAAARHGQRGLRGARRVGAAPRLCGAGAVVDGARWRDGQRGRGGDGLRATNAVGAQDVPGPQRADGMSRW